MCIERLIGERQCFRSRDLRHHRSRPAGQVPGRRGQRRRPLAGHQLSQRGLGAAQHRQRHEEPAGHRRGHRHHLQGGRDVQGFPGQPQRQITILFVVHIRFVLSICFPGCHPVLCVPARYSAFVPSLINHKLGPQVPDQN